MLLPVYLCNISAFFMKSKRIHTKQVVIVTWRSDGWDDDQKFLFKKGNIHVLFVIKSR